MDALNQEIPPINIFTDTLTIDVTHWRLEDKDFQAKRRAKWPDIEAILAHWSKSKKAINVIKKYYLKGETPQWQKIADETDSETTYLDIATFIWLHPSSDPAVLVPLRDAYFQGFGRCVQDVIDGMNFIYYWGAMNPACNGAFWPNNPAMTLDGKGELLFNLIFNTNKDGKFEFGRQDETFECVWNGEGCLGLISDWLTYKPLGDRGQDMVLQYDEPLELTFYKIKQANYSYLFKFSRKAYEKWLYRIAFFDTEKEGNTVRTICIAKVRKLLDDESIPAELASLWNQVKNGEIAVKNPWKL